MNTLKYVLRYGWFWPLEFWMRPFTVLKRIQEDEWKEFLSALVGSVTNGFILVFLFINTELITTDKAIAILITSILSILGIIATVFAVSGAISGALSFISIICITTAFVLRIYAYESSLSWAIFSNSFSFSVLSIIMIIKSLIMKNKIKYILRITVAITTVIIISIYAMSLTMNLFFQCTNIMLMIVSTFMLIIVLSSLFDDELTVKISIFRAKNTFFLLLFFWIPSLSAIINPFSSNYTEKKFFLVISFLLHLLLVDFLAIQYFSFMHFYYINHLMLFIIRLHHRLH